MPKPAAHCRRFIRTSHNSCVGLAVLRFRPSLKLIYNQGRDETLDEITSKTKTTRENANNAKATHTHKKDRVISFLNLSKQSRLIPPSFPPPYPPFLRFPQKFKLREKRDPLHLLSPHSSFLLIPNSIPLLPIGSIRQTIRRPLSPSPLSPVRV